MSDRIDKLIELLEAQNSKKKNWLNENASVLGLAVTLLGALIVIYARIVTLENQVLTNRVAIEKHETSPGHGAIQKELSVLQSDMRLIGATADKNADLQPTVAEILTRVKVIESKLP